MWSFIFWHNALKSGKVCFLQATGHKIIQIFILLIWISKQKVKSSLPIIYLKMALYLQYFAANVVNFRIWDACKSFMEFWCTTTLWLMTIHIRKLLFYSYPSKSSKMFVCSISEKIIIPEERTKFSHQKKMLRNTNKHKGPLKSVDYVSL